MCCLVQVEYGEPIGVVSAFLGFTSFTPQGYKDLKARQPIEHCCIREIVGLLPFYLSTVMGT